MADAATSRKLPGLRGRRVEFHSEKRRSSSYRYAAVAVGLIVSAVVATATSPTSPEVFFEELWNGTFGTAIGFQNLLILSTPLIFTGLAAALPYRIKLWNIGADGQMIFGAWAAAAVAFSVPGMSGTPLIILMLLASVLGGAAWMAIPMIGRVWLGINEILTTLLFNFIAGFWLVYWGGHVWPAVESAGGVTSKPIPTQSHLPLLEFGEVKIPSGFVLGVVVALVIWVVLRYTRIGYELSITSSSEKTASYAGISVKRRSASLLLVGGALAGVGGAVVMMGNLFQYSNGIANTGVTSTPGYTGIVIAILAAASEPGVIAMAVVFGIITAASTILLVGGASANLLPVMLGATLVIAAIGQGLAHLRLVRTPSADTAAANPSSEAEASA